MDSVVSHLQGLATPAHQIKPFFKNLCVYETLLIYQNKTHIISKIQRPAAEIKKKKGARVEVAKTAVTPKTCNISNFTAIKKHV